SARCAPARGLRAVRSRGHPSRQPRRLRTRSRAVLRVRGRAGHPELRRRLGGNVDQQRLAAGGLRADARVSRGPNGDLRSRRATSVGDGGERGRVDPQRTRHRAHARRCAPPADPGRGRGSPGGAGGRAGGTGVGKVDRKQVAEQSGVPHETLTRLASILTRAKPSLVIAGGAAGSGPDATALQYVVSLLNATLGNVGKTVRFGADWAYGKATPYAEVSKLVQAMGAGEIEVLLLGPGANPAFTLPGGLKAAEAIRKVPFVVSFANQPDETTALAHLVLPDTHWLESWGDYSPRE